MMVCPEAEPAALSPSLIPAGDRSSTSFPEHYLPVIWCFSMSRSSLSTTLYGQSPEVAQILPLCSESPRPSARQHGTYREKQEKPAKFSHWLWECSRCCKRGMEWDGTACSCSPPSSHACAEAKSAGKGAFLGLKI